jgi:outer membrane protein TolC
MPRIPAPALAACTALLLLSAPASAQIAPTPPAPAGPPVPPGSLVVVPQDRLAELLARLPAIRTAEAAADAAVRAGATRPSFLK